MFDWSIWIRPLIFFLGFVLGCSGTRGGRDGDDDSDTQTTSSDWDTEVDLCVPGEIWCQGNWVAECNEQGSSWNNLINCADSGLVCAGGECLDISQECATAINGRSYIGCEYWTTTLANFDIWGGIFHFAIAVANGGDQPATVRVTDGAGIDQNYTVPAQNIYVITDLPWKTEIKDPGTSHDIGVVDQWYTRQVANGAYHLTADLPVTVYQFNPLNYFNMDFYSYTNDASLLLPAHVLAEEYLVVSRPTIKVSDYFGLDSIAHPGLFAIVAQDGEPTTVEITMAGRTRPSDNISTVDYSAASPGQVVIATLQPYDVLQFLSGIHSGCDNPVLCNENSYNQLWYCCESPPEYDLTGTEIRLLSGPPPAVFGGSDCALVPYDRMACDHLEQQLFPLKTWGTTYLCAHNITQHQLEPSVWRVISGSDGNQLAFDPLVHPAVVLDKGEFIEFESLGDFQITGEGRLAVAQFMVGQNYSSSENPPENGDPSMSLAVPVEQYRTDYTFLAPSTYAHNYLTVIHPTGEFPQLDGTPVTGETAEIAGDYSRTNLTISAGIHFIESPSPFAIVVYGVGSYTSYMYPGGLDLKQIQIPIE